MTKAFVPKVKIGKDLTNRLRGATDFNEVRSIGLEICRLEIDDSLADLFRVWVITWQRFAMGASNDESRDFNNLVMEDLLEQQRRQREEVERQTQEC